MDWSTVKGTNGMMDVKARSNARMPASATTPHSPGKHTLHLKAQVNTHYTSQSRYTRTTPHNPGKHALLLLICSKPSEICKTEKLNCWSLAKYSIF